MSIRRLTEAAVFSWLIAFHQAAAQAPSARQLANPASIRCAEQGGMVRIETRPNGGQYGVCFFADNRQCEEWAMFRGDCPTGGLRVAGFVTSAARYCAITGGLYAVTANSGRADEQGNCSLLSGKVCDAGDYFAGTCGR